MLMSPSRKLARTPWRWPWRSGHFEGATVQTRTPEEKALVAALAQHGAQGPLASALDAWRAFKDFARTVELADGTGILFQVGTYAFEGSPLFRVDYVLQIESVAADGEHEGFEQLHCELTCPPMRQLQGVVTDIWSFAYPAVDDYYAAVEALPEFEIAVRQGSYRLRVRHEHV